MKQYDSYKDSGVEWIGEVPSHWEVVHLKQVLNGFQDGTHGTYKNVDNGRMLLSAKNVTEQGLEIGENERIISEEDYAEIVSNGFPKKEDILLCCVGTIGRCCIFNEPEPIAFQRSVTFLRTNKCLLYNKVLLYILRNQYVETQFNLFAKTSAQSGVYMGDLVNFYIAVPPMQEQSTIANYLDKKCSEIDNVISAQQKRIALLQELKQSVITHAVTKGLNPNVEMKDSGVEWIGEVPKHWDVMKTSLAFKGIGSGTTPSTSKKEFYDEEGKYWLQTGDLNDGVIFDTSKKVSDIAIKASNLKFYPKDSVVIAMYGATIGKVGILGIKTATNQACCVLPANNHMVAKYSFYEFLACKPALLVSAIGGGQPNISQDTIRKQKISVPPVEEQKTIADYLDKTCASIDSSISKAQHQVELLQEYKQSLITEVVTGKRKVS